ncbi:MAG: hypothetical protein ABI273_09070 [Lacunisphaera sp.]
MNTRRIFRGTLVATLITAVAGSAWQFTAIERNRLTISEVQSSIASNRKMLQELVNRRLLRKTQTDTAASTATPGWMGGEVSPTINESITALLHHVEDLKEWFEANPAHQIPEMRYLEEHDWIKESVTADLSTEEGARQFAASLRAVAVGRFADQVLKGALSRYTTDHGGLLPLTISELEPLIANPEDRPILDRYEMLVAGLANTLTAQNLALAIKPSSIVDPVYDRSFRMGPQTSFFASSGAPLLDLAYDKAQVAYANTHSGDLISETDKLLPYFSDPADAQKYIERGKKWEAELAARRAAAERAK